MRQHLWRVPALALLLTAIAMSFMPLAEAATTSVSSIDKEGFNIITSPLPLKLTTAPGRTVTAQLRMKNQGTQPEGIKMGLMKFGATGESGTPDLFNLTPNDTYASWVHFSPSQFVAQPNVWETVTMTINVPKDAALGYYLAATFSRAAQPGETGATNLNGSVATLVLLNVESGNEKRVLSIASFSADHQLYEYLPANFKVRLHNSGNIYIAPAGNIFISRGNKTVDTLDFNDAGGSVLPSANRVFTVPWSNGFPVYKEVLVNSKPVNDRHGQPKLYLKWDLGQAGKFRFGHYTAKLLAVYNDGSQDVPLQSSVSFWVLPWKIMLLIIVILLALGYGLWTLGRKLFYGARTSAGRYRRPNKGRDRHHER